MAFKLENNPTFPLTVSHIKPGEPDSKLKLTMAFKTGDELSDYLKTMSGKSNTEFLAGMISDWDAETPYSVEALGQLIDTYPRAVKIIWRAYRDELLGAEEKN